MKSAKIDSFSESYNSNPLRPFNKKDATRRQVKLFANTQAQETERETWISTEIPIHQSCFTILNVSFALFALKPPQKTTS